MIEGEFWYFSHDLSAEAPEVIRSISEGDTHVPQEGWQYFNPNTDVRRLSGGFHISDTSW